MKEPIDWVRAVYSGAIMGGLLWAIMVHTLAALTHGHPTARDVYAFFAAASLVILLIGVALHWRSTRSFWRSTSMGMVLAPLIGWSVILVGTITVFLPMQSGR